MKNDKLVLNLTKTKCMLFGTKQKLTNAYFKIQLHGSDIDRVRNFCYLGFILDEYLSLKSMLVKCVPRSTSVWVYSAVSDHV